jgi:glyoxylase-like metal-dependent hydrolase (beta-lactamase superfamily II)
LARDSKKPFCQAIQEEKMLLFEKRTSRTSIDTKIQSVLTLRSGRAVREISFNDKKSLTLGKFRAVDFFGDGSFYLLDTPGHAVGHLSGLARTTSDPDTFIFMGGDICHHGGELRPSEQIPIPAEIKPHPWNRRFSSLCPGAVLEKTQIERGRSANEPFFEPTMGLSVPEAIRSIRKAQEIDAEENVLFVFAHESSIRSVADFFPASANDWKQKGWKEQTLWAFLKDFQEILETDC